MINARVWAKVWGYSEGRYWTFGGGCASPTSARVRASGNQGPGAAWASLIFFYLVYFVFVSLIWCAYLYTVCFYQLCGIRTYVCLCVPIYYLLLSVLWYLYLCLFSVFVLVFALSLFSVLWYSYLGTVFVRFSWHGIRTPMLSNFVYGRVAHEDMSLLLIGGSC